MSGRAFIVRMNPVGISRVPVGLQTDEISIGWGNCGSGLLDAKLDRQAFAAHVHRTYYAGDENRIASGITTGQLWRFIRVMTTGDLVVVPEWGTLHVAEVLGDVTFDPNNEHWAFRRRVRWLTGTGGVRRSDAGENLRRSLHSQLTCSDITRVLNQVRDLVM